MKNVYKSIIAIVLVSLFVSLLSVSVAMPASAQENFIVSIGQDKIFTTSNFHNTEIKVAPHHPGQGRPSVIDATSDSQEAESHIIAERYQEGYAKGWVGVDFLVEAGEDGEEAQEAEISITFDYRLGVDFQVSPPEKGGGGSANAVVYGTIAGNQMTVDRINFVHHSNSDERSGTKTLTDMLTLNAGQRYQVLAHTNSYGDVYGDGYADSQCYILVRDIKIEFVEVVPIKLTAHYNLNIVSVPQGADIWKDGEYVGKTPKTITITDFEMHSLRLVLSGYEEEERTFKSEPFGEGEKEMRITLNKIQPTSTPTPPVVAPTLAAHFNLNIVSVPQGADILIDGDHKGKTPKTIPITDFKMHSLRLELSVYEDEEKTFKFVPGEGEKEMRITLNKIQPTSTPIPPVVTPTRVPPTYSSPTPSTPAPTETPEMPVPLTTYSPPPSKPPHSTHAPAQETPVPYTPTPPGFLAITVILAIICGYWIFKNWHR